MLTSRKTENAAPNSQSMEAPARFGRSKANPLRQPCPWELRFTLVSLCLLCLAGFGARADGQAESAPARQDEADWPMWGYDAARSAASPHVLAKELHLQWLRELPEPKRAWPFQWDDRGKLDFDASYAPVVMGDKLFVPSNVTDSVTAYHVEDGREQWRFFTDGPVRLAAAAWNGRVYFTSDDGHLYCVDAQTGELVWKFQAGPSEHRLLGNERIINFWAARGGPVVKDGTVYFAAGIFPLHGIFIYALDASTGQIEWVNDTTSSDYVELPHGGADGYGGLSPQGYLAADDDELVVAPGRGQSPVFLDRRTGKTLRYSFRGGKGGGGYAVHAVASGGLGNKHNDMLRERLEALKEQIDGKVFCALAARDRLFVTTEDGKLYCFGPNQTSPVRHQYKPEPMRPRPNDWADIVKKLLLQLGENEGYALVLGAGSGDLVRELLVQSGLHLVVVESDVAKVEALRNELVDQGMYGRRAAVIAADPAFFSVQPYLFSMVAAEDVAAVGMGDNPNAIAHALGRLRPYGGLAYLRGIRTSQGATEEALAKAKVAQVSVRVRENVTTLQLPTLQRFLFGRERVDLLLARRTGPLPGAGQWTHEHHDALNTNLSRDQRVRLPLGVLWFGGPNNHNILPRHASGPRPQVAGGRQVFLGVETIAARCVYTGRQLWERQFPGIGHPFTNLDLERKWSEGEQVYMSNIAGAKYIGSPFVTLPDAVYLRHQGRIHCLDPATGKTMAVFTPPGRSVADLYNDENAPDWGHHRVVGDYLITTAEPHLFEGQNLGWEGYSGTSSRKIAAINRFTGQVYWEMEAVVGFRHNAIIATEDTLYVVDGLSKNALEHLARRGEKPEKSSRLYALNVASGKIIWSTDSEVFGTYLTYSAEHDILIEGGNAGFKGGRPKDEPWEKMIARRGRTGDVLWRGGKFTLPGALRGDMLIPGQPGTAISLLTGNTWPREQPLTGTTDNWNYSRVYGCNQLNASQNLLLYRTGYAGYFDLEHDTGTGNFSGFKSGCTANLIAADGVLNALDYTRTCTCSYALQTSLALIHMPDDPNIEFWTRFEAAKPDPRGHGINFGAPGRRVDVAGSGRIWHNRDGNHRRHPAAIVDSGKSLAWVLASAWELETGNNIRIDDLVEGEYDLRLHFAELDPKVKPGDRVFDVLVNGEKMLAGFDIAKTAGGPFRGVVRSGPLAAGRQVEIELRPVKGTKLDPMINGIELIRK